MSETAVPVLWSRKAALGDLLEFYRVLGFKPTCEQTRPYVYGAVERNGYELHFTGRPDGVDAGNGCLVLVDDIAEYHREFTESLRAHLGKVPSKGEPRVTRFKPGQSRFTVTDPEGNWVIFIRKDEPRDLEYGGSKELQGLERVLDNVRILRDFKNDDAMAAKVLRTGLRRFRAQADPDVLARAEAELSELEAPPTP